MPLIGILLDARVYRGIRAGKTGNEHLRLYNKAASSLGLTPFYLCLERVNPSAGTASGYKYTRGKYRLVRTRIPELIHNRTIPVTPGMKTRLKRLNRVAHVFNAQNRYSKYYIHKLLKDAFAAHVPQSATYSKASLRKWMRRFSSIYVKPQRSSVGNGVMKLTQLGSGRWRLQLPSGSLTGTASVVAARVDRLARRQPYMVQQAIALARYRGKPYDIRVSVQRAGQGAWQVTGIVGKVARKGSHVTNVARGGTVRTCSKLLRGFASPAHVAHEVNTLSLNIASYLGKRLRRLADVGLDVGVDREGKPYFIELNCRDQRYSFKKAGLRAAFYHTYANPLKFAKHLLDSKKKPHDSSF